MSAELWTGLLVLCCCAVSACAGILLGLWATR